MCSAFIKLSKCFKWLNGLNRHKNMIFVGMVAFYLGCSITLSVVQIECQCADTEIRDVLNKVDYPVIILSDPNNQYKRDAIRGTWANLANNIFVENGETLFKWNISWIQYNSSQNIIKFFFPIGIQGLDEGVLRNLKLEQNRFNDLVLLENLEDSYQNLAQKMLLTLVWVKKNFNGLKYLVKCDDDSFVRIDLIIKDLEAFAPGMSAPEINKFVTFKTFQRTLAHKKGLYWGYFDGRARVYQSGKWQEQDWFLCDTYLPYALGGGYVISRSIVDYITQNAQYLSTYHSEDVTMGVWTAALDGINRVHDIRFDTEWKSRGCDAQMLVRHKQSPTDMFQMYRALVNSRGIKLCKNETAVRNFYHYKWDVQPTMCCK